MGTRGTLAISSSRGGGLPCRGRWSSRCRRFPGCRTIGGPAGIADCFGEPFGLGVLAAEADGEDGADIGMASQGEHEADGEGVVVAAGEADDVSVFLAAGDFLGDVAGALHGVDDQHEIAHAFTAILAKVALPDGLD